MLSNFCNTALDLIVYGFLVDNQLGHDLHGFGHGLFRDLCGSCRYVISRNSLLLFARLVSYGLLQVLDAAKLPPYYGEQSGHDNPGQRDLTEQRAYEVSWHDGIPS
jgi:hypothetical protein